MKKDEQHMPGICMAVATLLKERNREMCGVQSIISVASQVKKKVSTTGTKSHVIHTYSETCHMYLETGHVPID